LFASILRSLWFIFGGGLFAFCLFAITLFAIYLFAIKEFAFAKGTLLAALILVFACRDQTHEPQILFL
jgi:hypothetical protein